ncbi:restriction endonuclease [Cohnella ginsengisoli]|uniref:Restriction endonuclease n=1 Tax=Cohnella ginsengisoli TaxID=425004 RepID=A0A9X4KM54_9BACL|nr:restriction endonuclease [Cohnella ginsengisoli]MDG0793959.1 restriction endonuclease [Cohnella ginsengisoli]
MFFAGNFLLLLKSLLLVRAPTVIPNPKLIEYANIFEEVISPISRKRMNESSLVDLALLLGYGCAFLLAFNTTFSKYGTSIGGSWLNPLLVIIIIVLAAIISYRIYYVRQKLKKANIAEIDKMSGTMFERYLEQFFKRQGWKVERTGGKGDYGADLILTSATKKIAIQAKRWKKAYANACYLCLFTDEANTSGSPILV